MTNERPYWREDAPLLIINNAHPGGWHESHYVPEQRALNAEALLRELMKSCETGEPISASEIRHFLEDPIITGVRRKKRPCSACGDTGMMRSSMVSGLIMRRRREPCDCPAGRAKETKRSDTA